MTTTLSVYLWPGQLQYIVCFISPLFISACFPQAGGRSPLTWHRRLDALNHGSANRQIKTRDYVAAGQPGRYDRDAEVRRVAVSSYVARALGFGNHKVSSADGVSCALSCRFTLFQGCEDQESRLCCDALIINQALLVLWPFFLKSLSECSAHLKPPQQVWWTLFVCCDWVECIVWHSCYSAATELEVLSRIQGTMVSRSGFLWNILPGAVICCEKL